MEFPDYALIQLSSRDLTGPGVEQFSFDIDGSSGGAPVGTILLPASKLDREKLYMGRLAAISNPAAGNIALQAGITRDQPNSRLIWAQRAPAPHTASLPWYLSSDFFVVPGGKDMIFSFVFSAIGGNAWVGTFWGYVFPKGNLLSL